MISNTNIPFLKTGESVMLVLRRHWIVFVYNIFYLVVLVVSVIMLFYVQDVLVPLFSSGIYWGSVSLYTMIFLTFIYLSWINDELDLFIITNIRVIGIEQISVLSRTVTECGLDRIQEVNAKVAGILETIFGYGRVDIHTASEHSDMVVSMAPNPVENARLINNVIQEFRTKHVISFAKHPSTTN